MNAHAKWERLVVGVLVLISGTAQGEIPNLPDMDLSTAELAYQGPETLTLMITPDGTGGYFTTARTPSGAIADATITLHLRDTVGDPYAFFPREDIWIQSEDRDIALCGIFDLWPETDTDLEGMTHWLQGPKGGGYHEGPIVVYVTGQSLSQPPLALSFNSPDLTGNGIVSLGDVEQFAGDFFGAYHFRSDLHRDGVINLSDVTPLAVWMGRGCE
jgi:hypothetical protein